MAGVWGCYYGLFHCLCQVHQKLAINCAVNPCAALLGCLNAEYSGSEWGGRLILDICEEMFDIYGADVLGMESARELSDMVSRVRAC